MITGYRGSNPYDTTLFYCPYVPLQHGRGNGLVTNSGMIKDTITESIRQKGWWILSFECYTDDRIRIFDCIFELATGPFYFEDDRGELMYPYCVGSWSRTTYTAHLSSHEDAMMIYLALK